MTTLRIAIIFVAGLLCTVLLGAVAVVSSRELPAPPFPFNHRQHMERMFGATDGERLPPEELEALVSNPRTCELCHVSVLGRAQAGRPEVAICARCHGEEARRQAESPDPALSADKARLLEAIAKGERFDWTPVFDVAGHVYFSHAIHARLERVAERPPATLAFSHPRHLAEDPGLECLDCHGGDEAGQIVLPREDVCASCHAETDRGDPEARCTLCHPTGEPAPIAARWNDFPGIRFSHAQHLDADVPCMSCHAGIPGNELVGAASAPTMQTCLSCHRERGQPTRCLACHESVPQPSAAPLVACALCHGDVASSERLPHRADDFSMSWCIDCHEERDVTTDCLACHR